MELIERIKNDLKENLTEYRYIHSLGVMEMAEELAKVWKTYHSNVDVEKNILKAVEETLKMADQKEDVVLAFGSLSFLGEIVKAQKEVRK